ncbi:MAG TPA: hypothetical protein VFV10_07855 [Gammaproteobacteria bacterium]|nr:hypothetical protein [Gammaproteobacteria bacterium]
MRNGEARLRTGIDDLGKLLADLERLPRHQWDNYLWEFCSRFVQRRANADSPGRSLDGSGESTGGGSV